MGFLKHMRKYKGYKSDFLYINGKCLTLQTNTPSAQLSQKGFRCFC